MNRVKQLMMHCIVATALLVVTTCRPAVAADVTMVTGVVTLVSTNLVEVAGRRGMITTATSITSDGHPVSLGAIQVGMPAELEIDPAGDALDLRVKGAVE